MSNQNDLELDYLNNQNVLKQIKIEDLEQHIRDLEVNTIMNLQQEIEKLKKGHEVLNQALSDSDKNYQTSDEFRIKYREQIVKAKTLLKKILNNNANCDCGADNGNETQVELCYFHQLSEIFSK